MITGLPPTPLLSTAGGVFASIGSSLSFSQSAVDVTITPAMGASITIPAATDALAGMLDAARAAIIDAPVDYNDVINTPDRTAFFSILIDGGGAAIGAPITRYFYVPFAAATITGWVLMADRVGSITVDIWKTPFATGFPPLVGNSITGGSPMVMSSAQSAFSIPPPVGWTTKINPGDCLAFNVASATTVQAVTAQLILTH